MDQPAVDAWDFGFPLHQVRVDTADLGIPVHHKTVDTRIRKFP